MQSAIAEFSDVRDLLRLARVSARWRQTPKIARVCDAFRAARADCVEPEIVADMSTFYAAYSLFMLRGSLDIREVLFEDLVIRAISWFEFANLREISLNILSGLDPALALRCARLTRYARILAGNYAITDDKDISFVHDDVIARTLVVHGRLPHNIDMKQRSAQYGRFDEVKITNLIRAITWSVNPSREMTNLLETIADSGSCTECPYLCDIKIANPKDVQKITRMVFADVKILRPARAVIGPKFARFIQRAGCIYHIAAQFAYDTPEFGQYTEKLESAIRKKWRGAMLQLAASARNPDERVFDYVHDRLRDAGLIGRTCEVMWNCGGGFEELQRAVTRLESRGIVATFVHHEFWSHMRIGVMELEEAMRCISFIIARIARNTIRLPMNAARCRLQLCEMTFGARMRELIHTHDIVCLCDDA